ncbi:MAG: hypothetical protein P9L88_01485 [Candidatus Tantalella remota]|nr:hypothetical protein [Candidatus Tantalella remota]
MKKHRIFLIIFSAAIVIFLWKMIIMRSGFIYGDYSDQFYPWSMIYAKALKMFSMPFWTRYVQSGFPLMAEGQVGGFYPFNIAFFFSLPFNIAYNYVTIIHFVLAGIFTYAYTRKLGGCQLGATVAALVFCFGSAYAGCMINTATLKTLAWLPLILLLFEEYFDRRNFILMVAAGLALGVQFLAGATQASVYLAFLCVLYFFYGLLIRKGSRIRALFHLLAALVIAGSMFLPQYMLSREIAEHSWRAGATLEFALSGSLVPLNIISMVIPYPVTGVRLYLGVLTLLFLITLFLDFRKLPRAIHSLVFLLGASFFLALGRFNPIFVFLVKITGFYNFRSPSKFALFAIFALSVMSGIGMTMFFRETFEEGREKALKVTAIFLSFMTATFFIGKAVLGIFKPQIIRMGELLVKKYIYGKGFHRYDLDVYTQKVTGFYESMVTSSSMKNPFIVFSLLLTVFVILLCVYMIRKREVGNLAKYCCVIFIVGDLFVFSLYGTGFRGNILDLSELTPPNSSVFRTVEGDKGLFRVLPYDLASAKLPRWIDPSFNAVYGIDSVALYTPLVNDYYREELESLEVADNALGLEKPVADSLDKKADLLRMLNVKYVVSAEKLEKPFLSFTVAEGDVYLYTLRDSLPRAYVSCQLAYEHIDRDVAVEFVKYVSGEAVLRVNMPYEGFLVFSENRYPGWEVYVDGKKGVISGFSVIQAVKLAKGEHEVRFIYRPRWSLK